MPVLSRVRRESQTCESCASLGCPYVTGAERQDAASGAVEAGKGGVPWSSGLLSPISAAIENPEPLYLRSRCERLVAESVLRPVTIVAIAVAGWLESMG